MAMPSKLSKSSNSSKSLNLKRALLVFGLLTGILALSAAAGILSAFLQVSAGTQTTQSGDISDWRGFYILCRSLAPVLAGFFLFFQGFALVTIIGRGLYLRARSERVEKTREKAREKTDAINENEKEEKDHQG
ncbi:MAG: hypothetical protein KC777_23535 [Cyanobacteria bacterium HKST-UBA02]|nr:hypothetical protein [Cyanobacteria bacterium HKST-UBA02]